MVFTILFSYLSIISLPIPTYLDILHFLSENLILNPSSLCSDDSITKRLSVFFFLIIILGIILDIFSHVRLIIIFVALEGYLYKLDF